MLEASDFHPGRSGRNHLRVLAAATGIPRSRVEEVLEIVDLEGAAGRRAGGYSLGMRQRLSLAGALLGDPRVLVLDEPANGLDPQGIRWLRELLRSLAAEGRTIFISSHVLAEVEQIVDEVVIIHRGKFVVQATTAELVARAAGGIRVRSPQADQLRAALEEAGVKVALVRRRPAHGRRCDDRAGGRDRRRQGHRPPRARRRELVAGGGVPRSDLAGKRRLMRLVGAELLKVWTAPRTLLGIVLAELAIVLLGTIATLHSAANDPVLPARLSRDIATIGRDRAALHDADGRPDRDDRVPARDDHAHLPRDSGAGEGARGEGRRGRGRERPARLAGGSAPGR